jgi:hypothetical protein
MDWQYFVENFGTYVVLPAFAMLFIGYAVQRGREKKTDLISPDNPA